MPPVAFNALAVEPDAVLATNGVPLALDVALTNVGNVSATFEVLALAPNGWGAGAPFTVPLAPGATGARPYTLLPAGSAPGDVGTIRVQSPAPGSPYVQQDTVNVTVVGPCVYAAAQAAEAARTCANAEDAKFCVSTGVALDDLVTQLARWELDETNAALQARVRSAAALLQEQLAAACRDAKFCVSTDLTSLTAATTVADFCAPLSDLGDDLDRLAQRRVSARFVPGYDAALPGTPVTYTLRLANHGTLTTTYRTNLRIANGELVNNGQIVSPGTTWLATMAPGQVVTTPVVILPESLGVWTLNAQVEAVEDAFIQTQTAAGLNVVDAFVKTLALTADPACVETGVNSTTLGVRVANIANVPRAVTAQTAVIAPGGAPAWTGDIPLALTAGAPCVYPLAAVDTSGWAAGVYTLTLSLLDARGVPVPDGDGTGAFSVGQALALAHSITPTLVAPGTVMVTTQITTTVNPLWDLLAANTLPTIRNLRALRASVVKNLRDPGLEARLPQEAQPFTRYEETAWTFGAGWNVLTVTQASGGFAQQSAAAGTEAQLTFSGVWAHVGFVTAPGGGSSAVFIDGQPQGVINTSSAITDVTGAIYPNLGAGTHVLTLTTQSAAPVLLDFADVWDGAAMTAGRFEDHDATYVHLSGGSQDVITSTDGRQYTYTTGLANAWFLFTGDHVRVEGVTINGAAPVELWVDGVNLGTLDLSYEFTASPVAQTREGLGSGPHVLRLALAPSARLDAFDTTAAPFVGVPMVEWWDGAPGGYPYGVVSTAAGGVGQATFTATIGCPACVSVQRGASGAVADAYVWSGDWSDNGNGARLYSGYLDEFDPAGRLQGHLFCPARGLPEGGPALSLLRFDWTGVLPDGAYLLTATLGLTQSAASEPGQPVYVQRILSAWDEDAVTWGSFLEDFDSAVWGVFTPTAGVALHTVDVTALARSWLAGDYLNHGLVLNQPTESGYTVYWSSESADPAQRPWLRMCFLH